MLYQGKPWQPASTLDALEHGVGMIVQESGTISGITVAENLFLGEIQPFCGKLGAVNRKALYAAADQVLEDLGIKDIRGEFPLGSLDFQARKLVEIARVARKDPEILVVDETTTALSQHGRTLLYDLVKRYRDMGKAVLFISHDLEEIMEVCDTLTVLRDGAIIRHFDKAEFDADQIRTSMIGRQLQGDYYRNRNCQRHGHNLRVGCHEGTAGLRFQGSGHGIPVSDGQHSGQYRHRRAGAVYGEKISSVPPKGKSLC